MTTEPTKRQRPTNRSWVMICHRSSKAVKARLQIMRLRRPNESHGEGPGLPGCRGSQFPLLSFEPQSSLQSVVFLPEALAAHVRFPLVLGRRLASMPRSRPRSERIDRMVALLFPYSQVPAPPTPTIHRRQCSSSDRSKARALGAGALGRRISPIQRSCLLGNSANPKPGVS